MARNFQDFAVSQNQIKLNTSSPNLTLDHSKISPLRSFGKQVNGGDVLKREINQRPIMTSEDYRRVMEQRKKLHDRAFKLSNLINQANTNSNNALDKKRPDTAGANTMGMRKASSPLLTTLIKGNNTARDLSSNPQNITKYRINELTKPPISQKFTPKVFTNLPTQNSNLDKFHSDLASAQQTGIDNYTIGKSLGQGAYAQVKLAIQKSTGKKVAIKIYEKIKLLDPNRKKSVLREIKIMQKFNHLNIVKLYEAIDTSRQLYLVMEFVQGTSLHAYLKKQSNRRLEESEAKRIIKAILNALSYCHSKCVAHRDIKLENILIDERGTVKIIDFGFSTCMPNDKKVKIFCGTPSYMAPEIVSKKEYAGPPVDI